MVFAAFLLYAALLLGGFSAFAYFVHVFGSRHHVQLTCCRHKFVPHGEKLFDNMWLITLYYAKKAHQCGLDEIIS